MLADDRVITLWKQLSNDFNVHVRSIDVGQLEGNEITLVTLHEDTAPEVIVTLPTKFTNEQVRYKTSGPINPRVN